MSFPNLLSKNLVVFHFVVFHFPFCKIFSNYKTSNQNLTEKNEYSVFKIYIKLLKQPPEVFCKKGVLRNYAKFTGKQTNPVNFAKFLRTSFLSQFPI